MSHDVFGRQGPSRRSALGVLASAAAASSVAWPETASASARTDIDWPEMLSGHDMVWHVLPKQWNEGAFLGNGQLGLVVYVRDNEVVFHLGRMDVTDHRKAPNEKTSRGTPGASVMYDFPRLDLGTLCLSPAARIIEGRMRLDLWNAELRAEIATEAGLLRLRVVTLRDRMAHRIDITSTERDAKGQTLAWTWSMKPGDPRSPRKQVFPDREPDYQPNPPVRIDKIGDTDVVIHPLLAGGDFATAWRERKTGRRSAIMIVSTANEVPLSDRSAGVAAATVELAHASLEKDSDAHRAWWRRYWPQSFLTIPDQRLESFYWIQVYKLAAASRPDGPPIDVLGPFFRVSQWPGLWWNLNVQLTYSPVFTANRLELGESLLREIDTKFDAIYSTFRDKKNIGDLTWVLHVCWSQRRYAGDREGLRSVWLPQARIVIADYLRRLQPDAAGVLRLPATGSPEYGGFEPYDDASYNLSLLRWLLTTAIDMTDGEEARTWSDALARLAPLPTDANGIRIGRDTPLAMSHRHFSHLLGLWPLQIDDSESPAVRALYQTSIRHWLEVEDGKALAGYTFTGGAALYSAMGDGDAANLMLQRFLDAPTALSRLFPNTFYTESNGRNPVIETPLSLATALQDMLLQSHRGIIRPFPAVPSSWRDAGFDKLRAEGGFVVSALRQQSQLQWLEVTSEAGEPCRIKLRDPVKPLKASTKSNRRLDVRELDDGSFSLDLQRGETAFLSFTKNVRDVRPLPNPGQMRNPWGLTEKSRLDTDLSWQIAPPQ